jgi:hypothetical protein
MTVQNLSPEPFQCAGVWSQPLEEPALDCLENGVTVQVVGDARSVGGALWLPVTGGWMDAKYLAPTTNFPPPAPTGRTPAQVAVKFYAYLDEKRWPAAFRLLSSRYRQAHRYGVWVHYFDATHSVTIDSVEAGSSPTTVIVRFRATDWTANGQLVTRQWVAEWHTVWEEGEWRLDVGRLDKVVPSPPAAPRSPMPQPITPPAVVTPIPAAPAPTAAPNIPPIASPDPAAPRAPQPPRVVPTAAPVRLLTVQEVAQWCTPSCEGRLEQLREGFGQGPVNYTGVHLITGFPVSISVPAGYIVTVDPWDCFTPSPRVEVTGPHRFPQLCEASIRLISPQ